MQQPRFSSRAHLVFAVLVSSALSAGAQAQSSAVRWQQEGVAFTLPEDLPLATDDVTAALKGALRAWNGTGAGPELSMDAAPATSGRSVLDGASVVSFAVESWPYDPGRLAVALPFYRQDDGALVEVDIVLNAVEFSFSVAPDAEDEYDLQTVLTHEIGHALGLAHINDDEAATMHPRIPDNSIVKRELSDADELALLQLYGEVPEDVTVEEHASGGCASLAPSDGSAAGFFALLLFGRASRRRRRRG